MDDPPWPPFIKKRNESQVKSFGSIRTFGSVSEIIVVLAEQRAAWEIKYVRCVYPEDKALEDMKVCYLHSQRRTDMDL